MRGTFRAQKHPQSAQGRARVRPSIVFLFESIAKPQKRQAHSSRIFAKIAKTSRFLKRTDCHVHNREGFAIASEVYPNRGLLSNIRKLPILTPCRDNIGM